MIEVKVNGLDELRQALAGIVPKLRVRALRNALAAGARVVQKAVRARVPVINPGSYAVRKGYRTPGLVRQAVSVRTSKVARRAGDVGVFVNVRPAKGAKYSTTTQSLLGLKHKVRTLKRASQRGAKSPLDPYYWRFVNFGTRTGVRAAKFLQAGGQALPAALDAFLRAIGPAFAKLNKPKAPAP